MKRCLVQVPRRGLSPKRLLELMLNVAMLEHIAGDGARTIIVETANRFARDLVVQETGPAEDRR